MDATVYDVIGIGIGPYNLGLAALVDEQPDINGLFFEQTPRFKWHPGMLIEGTDLQVSFLADLVTFANPKSHYTYLNYLHETNRLYPFFFYHQFEIPRKEYDRYASWVSHQLDHCYFGARVVDVMYDEEIYHITVKYNDDSTYTYKANHVVMGTGHKPNTIIDLEDIPVEDVHHSSQYLFHKDKTVKAKSITLVGSGQSASEIFLDLLQEQKNHSFSIHWYTRSPGHFQLDQSKLGQEIFSPDYVDYFHQLDYKTRLDALDELKPLRNGVQQATLHAIYHELYHLSIDGQLDTIHIQPLTSLENVEKNESDYTVTYNHWQKDETIKDQTEKIILATGYKPNIPDWFNKRIKPLIQYESDRHYKVAKDHQLLFKNGDHSHFFTQTDLVHSHGSSATNLGLTVDRNVQIINTITNEQRYKRQTGGIFTQFQ